MVQKKTKKISKPLLKNLTIKNFRCFENFHLKDLKRVNIFVGDNNSGKSSVLEAVGMLYPRLEDHFRILEARGTGLFFYYIRVNKQILHYVYAITAFISLFLKKIQKIQ